MTRGGVEPECGITYMCGISKILLEDRLDTAIVVLARGRWVSIILVREEPHDAAHLESLDYNVSVSLGIEVRKVNDSRDLFLRRRQRRHGGLLRSPDGGACVALVG